MSLPIMGAHFRPPAKAILSVMPIGTELTLRAEPSNEYDPNAIMVLVPRRTLETLPEENLSALRTLIMGYGFELEDLPEEIHLGYVPRQMTSLIHPKLTDGTMTATLAATSTGAPAIEGV